MKLKLPVILLVLYLIFDFSTNSYRANASQASSGTNFSCLLQKYDIVFYDLNLNVERTSNYIEGNVLIKAKALSDLDTFAFQLHDNLVIDSVIINGRNSPGYSRKTGQVKVSVKPLVNKYSYINVVIFYRGYPPVKDNSWGQGFINKKDIAYNQQVTFSLSCPYFAYEWFPCKQDLYDKADSVYISVSTDTSNKVASNGLLKKVVELGNGKHRFEWQTHYPVNYYLIFISVGQYIEYNTTILLPGASKPMLIQNFVYPNALADVKATFDLSPDLLINFSSKFGLYPFINEKFGTYMAPISGGMEHQTMSLMGSTGGIDKYLNAHEMAHQWFGDALSIGTFRDVWLSEGFATYSELVTADSLFPAESSIILQNCQTKAKIFSHGSIFRKDTSNFDSIYETYTVYLKGMAVLHMIRFIINNDSQFYHIIKEYFTTNKFINVTLPAFKSYLEKRSKKDFTTFFNQWYYGYGFPVYSIMWNQKGGILGIKSEQKTSSVTPFFNIPIEYKLIRDIGDTIVRLDQSLNTQFYYLAIKGKAKDPSLKIHNPEKHDFNYYIYPNPGHDFIKIASNDHNLKPVTDSGIFNINGKFLKKIAPAVIENPVDISDLEPGVYYLKLTLDDNSGIYKFVKL
jgi:aminopeptidase N